MWHFYKWSWKLILKSFFSFTGTHIQTIHEGVREHNCNDCGKQFSVRFSLLRHIRQVHTKVQPYQCQFCPLKFSDWTTKGRHERTHTKVRPYKCNICMVAFAYSNVLKAHLKSHSNEPKFVCAVCSKAFTLKFNLEAHLKRRHLQKSRIQITKDTKPLSPLFIDTEPPQVLKCAIMPQFPFPHVQILNLPAFCFQNPNKPLKIFVANI